MSARPEDYSRREILRKGSRGALGLAGLVVFGGGVADGSKTFRQNSNVYNKAAQRFLVDSEARSAAEKTVSQFHADLDTAVAGGNNAAVQQLTSPDNLSNVRGAEEVVASVNRQQERQYREANRLRTPLWRVALDVFVGGVGISTGAAAIVTGRASLESAPLVTQRSKDPLEEARDV